MVSRGIQKLEKDEIHSSWTRLGKVPLMSLGSQCEQEPSRSGFNRAMDAECLKMTFLKEVPSEITISGGALQYKYLLGTSQIMDFDT